MIGYVKFGPRSTPVNSTGPGALSRMMVSCIFFKSLYKWYYYTLTECICKIYFSDQQNVLFSYQQVLTIKVMRTFVTFKYGFHIISELKLEDGFVKLNYIQQLVI